MKTRFQRWAATLRKPLENLHDDRRWLLKLAAISVLLSVLLTWPGVLHLNEEVIGSPDADGGKHFWTLWWIKHNVVVLGSIPHQTTLVNFPEGMALYPIEPLNGLGVSLLFFLPLVLATNLLALLNMSLTGLFGGLLGKALTGSKEAGLVCGILLQSSAFSMFTLHAGVGELQHLWWLPLCFLLWHSLRSRLQWRYSFGLGLALAGATLSCFYYGLFAGFGVAVLSLSTIWAGRKTPKLLLQYAVSAGLGLAIVLPVSSQFASSFGEGEPPRVGLMTYVTDGSHGQPVTDPPSARLQLSDLVQSADRSSASREKIAYGGGRYLGLPALLLGLVALVLVPKKMLPWFLVGITGVVFGLGSYLVSGGEVATTAAGARYEMPFLFLNRALGYLVEPVNFPVRFLALTATALAVAGAWASTCRLRGFPLGTAAICLALLNALAVQWGQMIPRPMPRFTPPSYPALQSLESDFGPLVDLTQAMRSDPETRVASQTAQLVHRQPIQSVPIERIEKFAESGQVWVKALPLVQWLVSVDGRNRIPFDGDPEASQGFALLRDRGFEGLLFLGAGSKPVNPDVHRVLTDLLGNPNTGDDRSAVWRLPDIPYSEEELEQLRTQHLQRVKALRGILPGELNRPLR
ncbi:MAG: hypothetical protein VXW32_08025 [Myxococcota bacterium]|nr:hypothetical protein [Myxococcota bacterium]